MFSTRNLRIVYSNQILVFLSSSLRVYEHSEHYNGKTCFIFILILSFVSSSCFYHSFQNSVTGQIHQIKQIKPGDQTVMHVNNLYFVCYPSPTIAVDTEASGLFTYIKIKNQLYLRKGKSQKISQLLEQRC